MNYIEEFLSDEVLNREIFKPPTYKLNNSYIIEYNDATLHCSFFPIKDPLKTVIFFYGNGECANDYIEMGFPQIFNSIFCNLLIVEYRGYGMSTGIPTLPLIMKDVYKIISSLNIDISEIILYGRSLGLFPVIEGISLFPDISGIILSNCFSSPITFLEKRFENPMPKKLTERLIEYFDFDNKIKNYNGETIIFHALDDNLVPYNNAIDLKKKFNNKCTNVSHIKKVLKTLCFR